MYIHIIPPFTLYIVSRSIIFVKRVCKKYLTEYKSLPAHKPFLIPVYEASIALAEYNLPKANRIMAEGLEKFSDHSGFLFESAQFCARKCEYENAIRFYEASWEADQSNKPRYTDALEGIAVIYTIVGERQKAIETYDRMITCIKEEWGYKEDDAAVIEVERKKNNLQKGSSVVFS